MIPKDGHNNMNLPFENIKLNLDLLNSKQDHISNKQDQFQVKFNHLGLILLKQEKEFLIIRTK